jgi:Reverse transcriptase (RNA-dependent DNA polymerase)
MSCDRIEHSVLLSMRQEGFADNRFLRLMHGLLKAGYLEEWTFNATHSGVPQGGVVSPILSNIVLDRLDTSVETPLIPAYTRGHRRRTHPPYVGLTKQASEARKQGHWHRARMLRQQAQQLPSRDHHAPNFRRL